MIRLFLSTYSKLVYRAREQSKTITSEMNAGGMPRRSGAHIRRN